ncbi:Carboxy-terminal processing protease [Thermobacillus xylanilyticus]|uniref:Carboxy-terminal processing protease n=1 Tax=Thermobacillus xylanilyticus TaxID=76633 RepID=A0ABN7SC70_THEXY|nr:S41 family peptidase [Thermobacillus xylanilyticus]CAG5092605.1 Carboxy-terminal processing protease [Thermobacillus xylanilyticus]
MRKMETDSKMKRQGAGLLVVLAVLLVTAAAGFLAGRWWMMERYPMLKDPAFANLDYTYREIMSDYLYGADSSELIHGAAKGMAASLRDPYSAYYAGEEGKEYVQRYDDHIVGIGVEIREEDGEFVVTSAYKGAPADEAGIRKDDVIVAVDGVSMKGKTMQELVSRTRGEVGTKVTITIRRDGLTEPFDVTLVREEIPVTTVYAEMLDDGIGKVQITRFAEGTGKEFGKAVDELLAQGMRGLLLDLRSNPGGLLSSTLEVASRLIPKDKVILEVVYKDEKRRITYTSTQSKAWDKPITVLIDESSASSAEVLAAALRDSAGAKLVGMKTFGKGVVQTFRPLKDGSVLKLTESEWVTPSGGRINKVGIEPHVEVGLPEYASLPVLPTDEVLKVGSLGQDVRTAELMLEAVGYDPGEPEGIYDERTAAAVERFQRDERLTPTGTISGRTAFKLMDRLRTKLKEEDPQLKEAVRTLRGMIEGK